MSSRIKWLAATVCLMMASACDESPSYDGVGIYKITGVLDPSQPHQQVYVARYVNLDAIDGEYELDSIRTTVSGAIVEITGEGGTTVLEEESPGRYTDRHTPMNLTEGDRYDLLVRTPDGTMLSAGTVVPQIPVLINPPDTLSFEIKVDSTMRSYWNGTDSVTYAAYRYWISWRPPLIQWAPDSVARLFSFSVFFEDTGFYGGDSVAFENKFVDAFWNRTPYPEYGDNSYVDALAAFSPNVPPPGHYTIPSFCRVVSVDRALAEARLNHVPDVPAGSNISGGLGFFGSRNEFRRPITVTIDVIHEHFPP